MAEPPGNDADSSPILNDGLLDNDESSERPTLVTRFTKNSDEWMSAQYFNVRNGEKCRITLGDSHRANVVPVRSYGQILTQYLNNPESKFLGPNGKPCMPWTRGVLQRGHIIAGEHRYCGKEMRRKLEQGPIDHEVDYKCRVYSNGKIRADAETRNKISTIGIGKVARESGIDRKTVRFIASGGLVKTKKYRDVTEYLQTLLGKQH